MRISHPKGTQKVLWDVSKRSNWGFSVTKVWVPVRESLVASCSVLNSPPSSTYSAATEETNIPAGVYFSQYLVVMTYIYWQVMKITPWGKGRKQNASDVLEMMEECVACFGYRMTLFYRHQDCLRV